MSEPVILFAEDDASGRELGVFNLKKAGYTVEAAATGDAPEAEGAPAEAAEEEKSE